MSTLIKSEEAFNLNQDYVIVKQLLTGNDELNRQMLTDILTQLKRMEFHLARISGEEITPGDIEEE